MVAQSGLVDVAALHVLAVVVAAVAVLVLVVVVAAVAVLVLAVVVLCAFWSVVGWRKFRRFVVVVLYVFQSEVADGGVAYGGGVVGGIVGGVVCS